MHTMQYYSATKKMNEILACATEWMPLEIAMLGEISQTQKGQYHVPGVGAT